ncbi:MAG: ATP-dependent helicase [Pseudonocardiales bacterium]|nr:MAG: ATP-dependent helicase [Pseudonocardiales bacterium]
MTDAAGYRLVRPAAAAAAPAAAVRLDPAGRAVVDHRSGPLLVLAGPGTGKTTLIVEAVVEAIEGRGIDPESVLVLTFSRRAAAELRQRITARLARTVREPLARTFHSYAFGLLRMRAALTGGPAPRLLAGPEQDLMIRDLLAGNADTGSVGWPAALVPALRTRGFAAELRDLLMRAVERGVDAPELAAYGVRLRRPEWEAAAQFLQDYRDVTALAGGVAYDPAELIRAAVDTLESDPELLEAERRRRRVVIVDEYQDTDPAQEQLLELIAAGADAVIVVGDHDQSIYGFRGADPGMIRRFPETFTAPDGSPAPTVALDVSHRAGPVLLAASRRIAARLPGPAGHRDLVADSDLPAGELDVAIFTSASAEAAHAAHVLRSAHLRDGVAWDDMAVLVRSTVTTLPQLRRALSAAGVPVEVAGDDLPLAQQPVVAAILLLLRCAIDPQQVNPASAVELLRSPLGGADAVGLHRLRRELRRADTAAGGHTPSGLLLAAALHDPTLLGQVRGGSAQPAERVAGLLATACERIRAGASAEDVLWAVWSQTRLELRWERQARAGGLLGAAADSDLDAVVALFDAAARYVDRMPAATVDTFLDSIAGQQIPGDRLAPAASPAGRVRVLTAHAAKGMQWEVVVVAGVQEGSWPDLRRRGTLLGSETLVDVAAGIDPALVGLPPPEAMLAEERRLFYVAVTRARRSLTVTAVLADDETPSRFLDELDPLGPAEEREPRVSRRSLSLGSMVCELRGVVTDVAAPPRRRRAAARSLARLAAAGVPGAEPDSWWGLAPLSDDRPLVDDGDPVGVSPSTVGRFGTCELQWFLERVGASTGTGLAQGIGTLIHRLAELQAAGAAPDVLRRQLDEVLATSDLGPPWRARIEGDRIRSMLAKYLTWINGDGAARDLVVTEAPFEIEVGRARMRGRVDRLERDADGRLVVVDIKTSASSARSAELARQPQLGSYQLAVAEGGFGQLDPSREPGGAVLLSLGSHVKANEQRQPPIDDDPDPQWARQLIQQVAEGMGGASFRAVPNSRCPICVARHSCPASPFGVPGPDDAGEAGA